MISGRDIICISNTTWHGPYTKSTVQLLSGLSVSNRILFVEYAYTIKDVLTTLIGKQRAPLNKMFGLKPRLVKEKLLNGSSVYILNVPPVLPFDFRQEWLFRLLNRISVRIYQASLKKAISQLGFSDPVVITAYNPFYGLPLMGKLNEKLHVYYCYDAPDTGKHGKRALSVDAMFCSAADGVIVTSDNLLNERKKLNRNIFLVKNGVDTGLFKSFTRKPSADKGQVKIGYIGSIDERFDFETVLYVVRKKPEWLFEFTGDLRYQAAFQAFRGLNNVRFNHAVKARDVPGKMTGLSAGIIPYKKNEMNRNIYPLKINEYLAMGIPVVMTDFASLPEFEGIVSVAQDPESFLLELEKEVYTDSESKSEARISLARANSWDNRTELFSECLGLLLAGKNAGKHENEYKPKITI